MNSSQAEKIWYPWSKLAGTAPARFRKYGQVGRQDTDVETLGDIALTALSKVVWNTCLAECLTPVLQATEIALRNWMDAAIRKYQAMCGDAHADEWLLYLPAWVHPKDRELVEAAQAKLQYQVDEGNRDIVTHDDIVATTSFSLWSNMLRNNCVWSALSNHNAGRLIKGESQKSLHKVFDDIRNLRNRAYHLEPIFAQADLNDVYLAATKFLELLDPRLHTLMSSIDRFPLVYGEGEGWHSFMAKLYTHYGLDKLED